MNACFSELLKTKAGREIEAFGEIPIYSYNQTDFVKDRVAIEVQFGKYSLVAYYEGEFYNVVRQGRGVPAVPLVIIGIEPETI